MCGLYRMKNKHFITFSLVCSLSFYHHHSLKHLFHTIVMNGDELSFYEGKAVCFFHRLCARDAMPSRWGRGVVYQGMCYNLLTVQHGKPAILSVHLQAIKPEYVAEISILKKSQQTSLERVVRAALVKGEISRVSIPASLVFKAW